MSVERVERRGRPKGVPYDGTRDDQIAKIIEGADKARRDKIAIEAELRRTQAELEAVKGVLKTCAKVIGRYGDA
jgi:hypothetical protein